MNSGIYTITNLKDNKIYLGYCKDFIKRERVHFNLLNKNKHNNRHLQLAVNKYGIKNFKFEVLEECDSKFLCSQEHYWCNLLNVHNSKYGYNIRPTHPFEKYKSISEESKKLIGINSRRHMTGRKLSKETKDKMSSSAKRNKANHAIFLLKRKKVTISYDNISKSFESISDLCKFYNFSNCTIGRYIKSGKLYLNKYLIENNN